jgi:tetratricopeptide (TPR) repeat protein
MEADTRRKVEMWAEALELFREAEFTWGVAYAVHLRGRIAHSQGRFEEAAALYEESADLWRQIGDPWGIGWSLNALAWVARARGDLVQAAALLEESLAVRKAHGYKSGIATSLYDLGNIMREQGNYERAAELFEESLALRRDLGAKDAIAWTLYRLGEVTSRRGDLSGAAAFYKESLALWRDLDRTRQANRAAGKSRSDTPLGDDERTTVLFEESLSLYPDREDKHGVALGLEGLAAVMVAQDRPIPAARLFGAAEGMREAISTRLDLADEAEYERRMALARDRIGVTDFTEAWAEGRGLTVERAIGYALDVG